MSNNKKEKIGEVLSAIKDLYEKKFNAELGNYEQEPYKVLMATILSQRTRDEVTHAASSRLFERYPTVQDLASADVDEMRELIRPVGFYHGKAEKLIRAAQQIVTQYGGKVPEDINALLELPGVGRKTANCVLVYGYNKPAIAVDTHVHRLSNMWGWVHTKTPEETERELEKVVPHYYWLYINDLLVKFGQNICRPNKHQCDICPKTVKEQCPQCCK